MTSARAARARRAGIAWRLAAVAAFAVAMGAAAVQLDAAGYAPRLEAWVRGLGAWGPVAFVAVYVAATLAAVPGTPFTVLAPLVFGPWQAFGVMVVASLSSAGAAFLIARYLAREAVARRLAGNPAFQRLERLLARHAWLVIPFVRVVPFPFALNNYGLGLTAVPFWRYLGYSAVGMVPMNAVLVFGVDALVRAAAGRTAWPQLAGAAAGGAAVAAVALAGRRLWRSGTGRQSR